MESLKEVFDEHFSHVKFDLRLAKAIYQYQVAYVNTNHEHLEFFGSNLLGAHVVRFKDADVYRFFDQVVDVNYLSLLEDIRKVPTINHTFKISGDIFNLTLMYVVHRFMTQDTLPTKDRDRAAYDTALIFFYRSIAALLSHYFKYPADPKIAQAAYANLSKKFLIKQLGSWSAVMDYRAKEFLDKKSVHHKELISFTDDERIVYAINDAQGRVKSLVKTYYAEFIKVHSEGERIGVSSSTFLDAEGEETVREKTRSTENYVAYMRQAIADEHTFIKDDLVGVIARLNTNTSFRMIRSTLLWMQQEQNNPKHSKDIFDFMSRVIVQSMHMIEYNMEPKHRRDYPYILHTLKNLYLSTRTVDPDIEKIRQIGFKIVSAHNRKASNSLKLSTRTCIILYITLRALVGQQTT